LGCAELRRRTGAGLSFRSLEAECVRFRLAKGFGDVLMGEEAQEGDDAVDDAVDEEQEEAEDEEQQVDSA